jgi:hypothetical protein
VRPLCQEFQDPIWTYYRKTLIREIDAISPLSAPLGRQGKWRVDADAFGFLFAPHGRFVSIPQKLAFVQRRKAVLFESFGDNFADYCRLLR